MCKLRQQKQEKQLGMLKAVRLAFSPQGFGDIIKRALSHSRVQLGKEEALLWSLSNGCDRNGFESINYKIG